MVQSTHDKNPERKELKASVKTGAEVPVVTIEEVGKHSSKEDLWIVIHGKGEPPVCQYSL